MANPSKSEKNKSYWKSKETREEQRRSMTENAPEFGLVLEASFLQGFRSNFYERLRHLVRGDSLRWCGCSYTIATDVGGSAGAVNLGKQLQLQRKLCGGSH